MNSWKDRYPRYPRHISQRTTRYHITEDPEERKRIAEAVRFIKASIVPFEPTDFPALKGSEPLKGDK